jgi:hypothetical protein
MLPEAANDTAVDEEEHLSLRRSLLSLVAACYDKQDV